MEILHLPEDYQSDIASDCSIMGRPQGSDQFIRLIGKGMREKEELQLENHYLNQMH